MGLQASITALDRTLQVRAHAEGGHAAGKECAGQVHTLWGVLTCRSARQMALLHLKPEPKAICQTRSPRFTPVLVSMLASTYLKGHRTRG